MGYFTGVMDVYFAPFAAGTTDTIAAKPTYKPTPAILGKAIEVTITPGYKEGKLHASNTTVRSRKQVDTYTVSINADKIAPAVLQEILGRTVDAAKVQKIKGSDKPINLALGLAYTMDDGAKELWWLYKGNFSEPVKSGKTEADNIEYQTPTVEGVFLRRIFDDKIAAVVEVDQMDSGVGKTWFSTVYEAVV